MKRPFPSCRASGAGNWFGVATAVLFTLFGALVLWEGSSYPLGTLTRMGAGFLPVVLGVTATLIGLALIWNEMWRPLDAAPPRLRPVLCVTGAVVAFALLIKVAGLVAATFALVLIASLAEGRPHLGAALLLAAGLSAAGTLLFVVGLGLPVHPLPFRIAVLP